MVHFVHLPLCFRTVMLTKIRSYLKHLQSKHAHMGRPNKMTFDNSNRQNRIFAQVI